MKVRPTLVVVAGLLILTPYCLFLIALDLAPAAPVAAVRETATSVLLRTSKLRPCASAHPSIVSHRPPLAE